MRKTALAPTVFLAAVLLVAGLPPLTGTARGQEAAPQWALVFENDTPRALVLPGPVDGLTYYWYVVYRVKNPTKMAVPTRIEVGLELTIKKETAVFEDVHDIVAEGHIEKKIIERPLLNWSEMASKKAGPLEPGKSRECVAIFRVGSRAAEFDTMRLIFRGLAARTQLGREGNVQKFRERILNLDYDYVDSRWADTKELKYNDERWVVKTTTLADRVDANQQAVDESAERLKKLRERIEKLRKNAPKDVPKAPGKSSAAPAQGGILGAAQGIGLPAPQLVQALRQKASKHASVRLAFTQAVGGPQGRRQQSTGIAYLRGDGRFATERSIDVGTPRALKELRVFDGKSLWIHTATRELGDGVRRWDAAATKKEWRTVASRGEVSFATVVNPLKAWCLFGGSLVRLGVEQLDGKAAHVLEARPDASLQAVLGGPLAGDLLGHTGGRRFRFWIDADSGIQLRMRVYDAAGAVVATLECSDTELDADLPASRFAFAAPKGVKVIDMNALMAANDKP
ncbi:MAG: hypothetical protein ISS72_00120 [Candidatus Brocadiae bacterium]|nr:hypothetical protein [Candidatus Brocadiia bacterium]